MKYSCQYYSKNIDQISKSDTWNFHMRFVCMSLQHINGIKLQRKVSQKPVQKMVRSKCWDSFFEVSYFSSRMDYSSILIFKTFSLYFSSGCLDQNPPTLLSRINGHSTRLSNSHSHVPEHFSIYKGCTTFFHVTYMSPIQLYH